MNLLICRKDFPFLIEFWYQDLNFIYMNWLHILRAVITWLVYVKGNSSTEKNRTKPFSKKDYVLLCFQITSQVKTWKLSLRSFKDLVLGRTMVEFMFLIHIIPVFPPREQLHPRSQFHQSAPTAGLRHRYSFSPAVGTRLLHPCRYHKLFPNTLNKATF